MNKYVVISVEPMGDDGLCLATVSWSYGNSRMEAADRIREELGEQVLVVSAMPQIDDTFRIMHLTFEPPRRIT